jgi:hypothetical protein
MSNQKSDLQERTDVARRSNIAEYAQRLGVQTQTEQVSERKFNPDFLGKLQEAGVDTELFDWIENELGPVLSGSHILGARSPEYEQQQTYLNWNKAERMVAERSPGRLLARHPGMLASFQGIDSGPRSEPLRRERHPEFNAPIDTQRDRRVLRDAIEVATTKQTLAISGKGIDSVTTATSENRTVDSEDSESGGVMSRIRGLHR